MLQLIIDIFLFLIYVAAFLLLLTYAYRFWMLYVNNKHLASLKWVLLEIKLPREINKSPEATELWLRSIIDGGGLGEWHSLYWKGNLPITASLEIASLEGVIHFYIRIQTKFRQRVEAAIYSQYPDVEIIEAKDYTEKFYFSRTDEKSMQMFATGWTLAKSGEAEVISDDKQSVVKIKYSGDMYPIKTYKDWGLDKDPKEMFKHDPLTYLLESMATAGPGENFLYQIVLRDAGKFPEIYTIKDAKDKAVNGVEKLEGQKKISDLATLEIGKYKNKLSTKTPKDLIEDDYGNPKLDKDGNQIKYAKIMISEKSIPESERDSESKDKIKAIQSKTSKPMVIAKMRFIYIANEGKNIGNSIPIVMSATKPFNEEGFNSFKPEGATGFDFPWQDTMKRRVPWKKQFAIDGYKGRGGLYSLTGGMSDSVSLFLDLNFFKLPTWVRYVYSDIHEIIFHPFTGMSMGGFILNVEELATLYHFPGEVAATPGLPRIDSVKGSAPANVPR